jgi:hypothetical protein
MERAEWLQIGRSVSLGEGVRLSAQMAPNEPNLADYLKVDFISSGHLTASNDNRLSSMQVLFNLRHSTFVEFLYADCRATERRARFRAALN